MSRTYSHADSLPADTRVTRGQLKGRPPVRRSGTRAAIVAAAIAEHYGTEEA